MSRRIVLLGFILLWLSGCSLFPLRTLAPEHVILLPPNDGPDAGLLKQKVTMDARGEQHQIIVVIRLEPEQLKLRALLPTGQPLLSLDYDGSSLQENNLSSLPLPSEEILAVMQFSLWPIEAIKKHYLVENGWLLDLDSKQRILKTTAGIVVSVRYVGDDEIIIEHHLHHYRVMIKTLEKINL